MRVERRRLRDGDGEGAALLAAEIRGRAPAPGSVAAGVAEILADVRARGDRAVLELTARHDLAGGAPRPLRVEAGELREALERLDPAVRDGLEVARANVEAVARAGLREDRTVPLPQGHRVVLREAPVGRAAIYVPGGRAPYPSTVVMGAATAGASGVSEIAVCAPPGPDGEAHPAILAACALCGVEEVYRMGGAQAIGALAFGTATIGAVDVVVGPGNLWVTEAKRQVFGAVGIDALAGPSDLLVLADERADPRLVAFDLLAQGEHGPATVVVAVSPSPALLDALRAELEALSATRVRVDPAAVVLVDVDSPELGLALSEAFAPEHLELVGPDAEALAPRVRRAGALFVGAGAGTAFGDYVTGSNHVLPTGGAARFASGLGPAAFRRRMAEVHVGPEAAAALARVAAPVARVEGFDVHAESMQARIDHHGAA